MLRYKTKTRPGLVALYDIRPGNGAGPFLQPWSPHGAFQHKIICFEIGINYSEAFFADYVKHRLQSKFGEWCFSYAGLAAWNSLSQSIKLTTTDTNRFKQLLKSHLFHIAFWHFVIAPGQFVSRALQVRICICNLHKRERNTQMNTSHSIGL